MRKRFALYVLIPLAVLCMVVYIFIDRWVESGLETAGERAVGAKVEIDDLHVSLSPLGIQWARMQVTNPDDPWRNLFETRRVKFEMNAGQLLRSKYIIETMEINELILGTQRTTDGSLPQAREARSEQASEGTFSALARNVLDRTVEKTPLTDIGSFKSGINADSLVKALDIRTLKHLDSLKQQTLAASQQWNATLADVEKSRGRLADIEAGVKAINPSQLNTIPAITSALTTVDNAVKGINEISSSLNTRKAGIEAGVTTLASSAASTERIAAEDFARLKGMARLPNLNTGGIARLLIGEEMYKRASSYLHWIDFARTHIRNYQPKPAEENPPRLKGQNIHFPVSQAYPAFWIRKALISGGTDSSGTDDYIHAQGEIRNITDDQSVTQVPLTAALRGIEGSGRAFSLTAKFDRTKETPYDEFAATLGGVPMAEFSLGTGTFLAGKLTRARMNSSAHVIVPGNAFDANTKMSLSKFQLQFAGEPKNMLERVVREVLQGIDAFEVGMRLWNTDGGFDIALSTDLDDRIAGRVQGVLGAEFTKLQNDLKARFDATIAAKRAEVEKLVADKIAGIEKQLGVYESLVNEKLGLVDAKKKELAERAGKMEGGKANDLLKGILKK